MQQILTKERWRSWNVAPMQGVRIVRPATGPRVTRSVSCDGSVGVPSWARNPKIGSRMINSRSKILTSKAAAARRRGLVSMDGYYEWQKDPTGTKTLYFLHADGQGLLAAGCLYEPWPNPDLSEDDSKKWLWTATIATTSATDALGHIHDRTPAVIPPDRYDQWLDAYPGTLTWATPCFRAFPNHCFRPAKSDQVQATSTTTGPSRSQRSAPNACGSRITSPGPPRQHSRTGRSAPSPRHSRCQDRSAIPGQHCGAVHSRIARRS